MSDDKPAWAGAPGVTLLKHRASGDVFVHGSKLPQASVSVHQTMLARGIHSNAKLQSHFDEDPTFDVVHYFTTTLDGACELEMAFLEHYFDKGVLINDKWPDVVNETQTHER